MTQASIYRKSHCPVTTSASQRDQEECTKEGGEEGEGKGRRRKRQDRKEKEREVRKIRKFIRDLSLRIFLSRPISSCCPALWLSHIIILSTTLLRILFLLGFMSRSTSSLSHVWRCIRFKRHALYFMDVIRLSYACGAIFVEITGVCTLGKREPIKTQRSPLMACFPKNHQKGLH